MNIDYKEALALIAMAVVISILNAVKLQGTIPVLNAILSMTILSSIIAFGLLVIFSYVRKGPNVVWVGLLTPVVFNLSQPLFGVPIEILTQIYPLAIIDSIVFAIGATGIYVLLKKKIK